MSHTHDLHDPDAPAVSDPSVRSRVGWSAFIRWFASSLERHTAIWLFVVSAVYAVLAIQVARIKLLWFDELFTYYTSLLPNVRAILASRADTHPPLQFLLVKLSCTIFGNNQVAMRLPMMVAFWGMGLSIFAFARARFSPVYAMLALLIAVESGAFYYAAEARPYALVLGFSGAALLFWQMGADGRHRHFTLPLLTLSIAGAMFSHYYAVMQLGVPLALGEVARTIRARRIDAGIWIALALGFSPMAFLFPMALRDSGDLRQYVLHSPVFWAKPSSERVIQFFQNVAASLIFPVVAGIAFVTLTPRTTRSEPPDETWGFEFHETAALLGFLSLPVVLVVFTKLRTGYFMDRYAEAAILGLALFSCAVARRFLTRQAAAIFVLMFSSMLALQARGALRESPDQFHLKEPPGDATTPLVIADGTFYLQAVHYLSPPLQPRLYYLADLPVAVTMPDFLPELALTEGRNILPGHIAEYRSFIEDHNEFWLYYRHRPDLEWLPEQLLKDGYSIRMNPAVCCSWFEVSRRR